VAASMARGLHAEEGDRHPAGDSADRLAGQEGRLGDRGPQDIALAGQDVGGDGGPRRVKRGCEHRGREQQRHQSPDPHVRDHHDRDQDSVFASRMTITERRCTDPLKGFAQNQILCEIVALTCELIA
jgi:hypothetical protein